MTRNDFISWARKTGWREDRFGHFQLEKTSKETAGQVNTYRLKLSRIAVRYEVKSSAGWVRLSSGYFSKLSVTPDNKIVGLHY